MAICKLEINWILEGDILNSPAQISTIHQMILDAIIEICVDADIEAGGASNLVLSDDED